MGTILSSCDVNQIPPVTKILLWVMFAAFGLQYLLGEALLVTFALWPLGDFPLGVNDAGLPLSVGFQPWQLLTYGFLHGNFAHLFLNALALFQFGGRLEQTWGSRRYLAYFLICVVGAGLLQLLVVGMLVDAGNRAFPTIGASGGIFGFLLAYAVLFPRERVMLLLPPIPMSARTLVIVFGVISLVMGVTGTAAGIAHFAHLGGMLFGWLVLRYWSGKPPFHRKRPPGPRLVR